jgi:hypothetical protein
MQLHTDRLLDLRLRQLDLVEGGRAAQACLQRGALGPWYDAAAQRQGAAPGKCSGLACVSLPIGIMAVVSLACLVPVAFLVNAFLAGTVLAPHTGGLIAITIGYVIVGGFFVAAVCGYMAGLIGTSQSPVSGVGILAVLGAAVVLALRSPAGTDLPPSAVLPGTVHPWVDAAPPA